MNFISKNKSVLLALFGLTTLGSSIYCIQFYFHYQDAGVPFPWVKVIFGHFGTYYLLLVFALPIISLAKNFRIESFRSKNLFAHVFFCLLFCLLYLFISVIYNKIIGFSTPGLAIPKLYYYAITHNFHITFIAYWTVVGAVYAFEYRDWFRKTEDEKIALAEVVKQRNKDSFIERVLIKEKGHSLSLEIDEIHWVEAFDNYIKLHCHGRFYLMRKTLRAFENQLNPNDFCRIHRSIIVNLSAVDRINIMKSGDATITLSDTSQLRVSRNFRKQFEEKMNS